MREREITDRAAGCAGTTALALAAALGLSGCASAGRPADAERPSVREGRNTTTPSGGLVPGQWPRGF